MKECPACLRCFPDQVNHCPGDGESLKPTLYGDTVLDGRYQLEKRLGQGGMGIVFKARHIFLKTQHAIKVILPDLVGNDPTLATRFRQEAMAAAAIQHPNTVSVTDYGVINGTMPFLVMEFIEGRSLHELLQVEGKLPPLRALEIILAICAGVGAAHKEEIVHRDLKPLNIILKDGLAPSAGVKVLDFGLAKIKSGELLGSFVAAQTQGMMGSPYYMAPEQWGDEDIDRRADIYSLGVILYQMLAGEVPFRGGSVPSIMNKHLTTPPVPLHERGVFVPPELDRAVRHALEKEAGARPQSMDEFVSELQAAAAACRASEAAARANEVGLSTMQIPPTATLGGGAAHDPATVAQAGVVERQEEAFAESEAETPTTPAGGAAPDPSKVTRPLTDPTLLPPDGAHAHGAETAHQRGGATGHHAGGPADHAARTAHGEAPTALLDSDEGARLGAHVERERRDEEESRAREIEEARAREAEEAGAREAEEARAREAEEAAREAEAARAREAEAARARAEEEERRRREAEEVRRRREEEEKSAASARGGTAAIGAVTQAVGAGTTALGARPGADGAKNSNSQTPPAGATTTTTGTGTTSTTTGTRVPLPAVIAAVAVLLLGGAVVLAYFVAPKIISLVLGTGTNTTPSPTPSPSSSPSASPTPAGEGFKPELVALPGGEFSMGRDDVPPVSAQHDRAYLLWVYNQWPANKVPVGAFEIDKTEVTNAEYADFVRGAGHPAPPGWSGDAPPAGSERLPVSSVSFEDVMKFAAWRSARDGTTYRLPTEAEWEYAAGGGGSRRVYPWGEAWGADRANLNGGGAKPVGSFPAGRTEQGLEDMIGNVWEWTSTTAAMYAGNNRTRLAEGDRGKLVVRGGSYESTHDGNEPVTVTARRWVARDFRSPVLGFRLVREP